MKFPRRERLLTTFLTLVLFASCVTLVYQWIATDSVASEAIRSSQ